MLVRQIMTESVRTAQPDTKIRDVALVMCFNKISGLPVVDQDGLIVGMISEKDILWGMFPKMQDYMEHPETINFEAMEREYKDVVDMRVSELMSTKVYTVEPDLPVLKAASLMFRHRIRRIPVAADGRLVGIISVGDVHKAIFQTHITER
jgi:CBS domain-containing protein